MAGSHLREVPSSKGKAPGHLSKSSAAVWASVMASYELDPDAEVILVLYLEAVDRAADARKQIERDGAVVKDRFNQLKAHPAVAIERDSALRAGRLWKSLDLEPDVAPGSPLQLQRKRRTWAAA